MAIRFTYVQDSTGFVFETSNPLLHKGCKKLTKKEGAALYKEQSCKALLKIIKPGQTVYTLLRSVSSSGMTRRISLFVCDGSDVRCIDSTVSVVTGRKESDKGGITVTGCGMDMGFALVCALGATLWPNGTEKPHGTRNGEPDSAGGYALKHRWL